MAKQQTKTGAAPPKAPPAMPEAAPMVEVPITVEGTTLSFSVGDGAADRASYFSLGVRKSGSTMLHRIIAFLAMRNGVRIVDVPGTFFRNGFTAQHWKSIDFQPLLRPGNIFTGFRNFPVELARVPEYQQAKKVFMYRDPRDALVSQYFSDAYSHSLPADAAAGTGRDLFEAKRAEALQTDIDEWVLGKCGGFRNTLMQYAIVLNDPTCLTLRYEDYVFQKRRLVHKVLQHFGWSVLPGPLDKFMNEIDIVPEGEDKQRFVRKAVPGDHRAKLKPETIRRLNNQLREVLALYDYY